MSVTILQQLAEFAATTDVDQLPAEVVAESKRVLLDSVGCALGGVREPKGQIGISYGQVIGGSSGDATILGTPHRSSIAGAAFANGELINALDFDAVLPPGHVAPYVIPGALAVAEATGASGKELIAALAVAHEISFRFGRSMDWTRDIRDGEVSVAGVLGYTSTVFGAAAAVARLRGASTEVMANALAIAGSISPVNSHRAWMTHAPASTIKYTMAGPLAQAALAAAYTAELGHRGDQQVLDDPEFGYPRFIGTTRWVPENLTAGLGETWGFPAYNSYKPYPHCRILHAVLDALTDLVETHDIVPAEIESIRVQGEGWVMLPVWLTRDIAHVQDGQFSIAHGVAVGAHRIQPGPAWQDPDLVFSPSVLDLMAKVSYEPHPDWVTAISRDPAARPSRVEVVARGTSFIAERNFPRGSPSKDPTTTLTDQELVEKFLVNAAAVLPQAQAVEVADRLLALEAETDVSALVRGTSPA